MKLSMAKYKDIDCAFNAVDSLVRTNVYEDLASPLQARLLRLRRDLRQMLLDAEVD